MFDARATATEFLDQPDCDPALAAASYRFMATVNFHFGGTRIVRRFLAAETAGRHAGVRSMCLVLGLATASWNELQRCDKIPLSLSPFPARVGSHNPR